MSPRGHVMHMPFITFCSKNNPAQPLYWKRGCCFGNRLCQQWTRLSLFFGASVRKGSSWFCPLSGCRDLIPVFVFSSSSEKLPNTAAGAIKSHRALPNKWPWGAFEDSFVKRSWAIFCGQAHVSNLGLGAISCGVSHIRLTSTLSPVVSLVAHCAQWHQGMSCLLKNSLFDICLCSYNLAVISALSSRNFCHGCIKWTSLKGRVSVS